MSLEQPETSSVMMAKPVKIEDDVECKSNPLCSTNGGSKSRQHLKEVLIILLISFLTDFKFSWGHFT